MSRRPRAMLCAGGVEQRAEQRRAHHRLLLAHRVLERDDVAQRGSSAGQAQPVQQLGRGEAPADDLVQAARREHVLGAPPQRAARASAARPRRGARAASRAARRAPSMRATSSIRSASRVTSVAAPVRAPSTSSPSSASATPKPSARGSRPALARDRHAEQPLDARRRAAGSRRGRRPGAADVDRARHAAARRTARPSARAATACASMRCSGVQPLLEARADASLRRPSSLEVRVDVRARPRWRPPSARASSSSETSRARAAHHAGDRRRALGVARSAPCRRRARASAPSSVVDLLALARAAHDEPRRPRRGRGRTRAAAGRSGASRSW